jgi:hypothetical protein
MVALFLTSLAANAVENKPKHVFVKSSCKESVGIEVLASLRQEIRTSAGYQLANSLNDNGGNDVVITVDIVCAEAVIASVRMVSVASLFGTGTCTFGTCSITPNQLTLQTQLCGESQAPKCGKAIFVSLDEYMSKDGGELFRELSEARKKAVAR